jgi:hypothetical protein
MASDSKERRTRGNELAEQLERHPEVRVKIEEFFDIVDNCEGDVGKADEAEQRLIELLREMGRKGMYAWAERKRVKVEGENDGRRDMVRREKKGSTGRRRSER